MKFMGYKRPYGGVGVRNIVLVLSSVVCANHVSQKIADAVPGTVAFCHSNGCGQLGKDKEQTQRTLDGIAMNPNIAAVLVVSLGCEGSSAERIVEKTKASGRPAALVRIQECGGTTAAIKAGIDCYHATVSKMLQNKHYLGDEFYPPIIDEETFEKARVEKRKRAKKLGRIWEPKDEPETDYPIKFKSKPLVQKYDDPYKQAEYAYSLIESEV